MEQTVKYYRKLDEPISLDELKSFLWGAATRLRGQIDAAGFKRRKIKKHGERPVP